MRVIKCWEKVENMIKYDKLYAQYVMLKTRCRKICQTKGICQNCKTTNKITRQIRWIPETIFSFKIKHCGQVHFVWNSMVLRRLSAESRIRWLLRSQHSLIKRIRSRDPHLPKFAHDQAMKFWTCQIICPKSFKLKRWLMLQLELVKKRLSSAYSICLL